jgi:hypothetical protein
MQHLIISNYNPMKQYNFIELAALRMVFYATPQTDRLSKTDLYVYDIYRQGLQSAFESVFLDKLFGCQYAVGCR